MKYIPGNQFINNTHNFGRYFKRGSVYTLKNIKKEEENKIKYIFTSNDKDKEIVFKTVKEADNFLESFDNI